MNAAITDHEKTDAFRIQSAEVAQFSPDYLVVDAANEFEASPSPRGARRDDSEVASAVDPDGLRAGQTSLPRLLMSTREEGQGLADEHRRRGLHAVPEDNEIEYED